MPKTASTCSSLPILSAANVFSGKEDAEVSIIPMGTWYEVEELGMSGWLCPALFKYFDKAPDNIYVKAEAQ